MFCDAGEKKRSVERQTSRRTRKQLFRLWQRDGAGVLLADPNRLKAAVLSLDLLRHCLHCRGISDHWKKRRKRRNRKRREKKVGNYNRTALKTVGKVLQGF